MGWAYCGTDSRGRDIGYAIEAVCDHPGCDVKIDRGLAYKCGPMHGSGDDYCEDYFCEAHLFLGPEYFHCAECYKLVDFEEDEDEEDGKERE